MRNIVNKTKASKKRFKALFKGIDHQWQTTFEAMSESVFLLDIERNILQCNKATLDNLGKEKYEEIIGHSCCEIMHGTNEPVEWCPMVRMIESGHKESSIAQIGDRWCEISVDPVINDEGTIIGAVHVIEDITEQKQIQKEIQEKQATLEGIFRAAPTGIGVVKNRVFTQVNERFCDLVGYSQDELLNKNTRIVYPSDEEYEYVGKENYEQIAKFGINTVETRFQQKDGKIIDVLLSSVPLDLNNISAGVTFTALDFTERKQAEEKIVEIKDFYKNILDNIVSGVWVSDKDDNMYYCNRSVEKISGLSTEQVIGLNVLKDFPEDTLKFFNPYYLKAKETLKLVYYDAIPIVIPADRLTYLSGWLIPKIKEGNFDGMICIVEDITERKKTEENLKESEEKYRYLFDNAQVGLYWSGITDGEILECNNTFAKLFGYDSREECLANYSIIEHYIDPNARSELLKEIRDNKEVKNYIIHVTRRDGTPIWLSISARIFEKEDRIEGAAIDITERKQAERELQLERDNFLNILNSMEDGVYIVDQNYNIEFVNPSLTKEFGQFEGNKCFKYFEDRNDICPRCKNKEIFQGKTVRGEWFSFKNQKIYDVIDTPLKNPDGSISKLGIFRDETDKKQAEKIIKESEENYRDLFENSPISLWEEDGSELKNYIDILKNSGIEDFRAYFDKNPEEVIKCVSMIKIVDINKKTLELYKANKKEDFFAGLGKIFTEESLYTFKELIINFAGGKTRFESEAINNTLNGETLHIFIVCEIVAGFKEDWSKVLVSIVDISGRKKAEQKLIESEEKYRSFVENFQGIAFQGYIDYSVDFFHGAVKEITGYTPEDFTSGRIKWNQLFIPEDNLEFKKQEFEKNSHTQIEYKIKAKDGTTHWILSKTQKFYSEIKKQMGARGIFIDITDKKRAEQQLKESEEKYREAYNRAEFYKDIFAHDINNILQSILSGTQISQLILDNPNKIGELRLNAEIIKEQVIRGAKLVSNVRKLSKLEEAGRRLEKIEILRVLKNTVSFVKKSYKDKNLVIRVDSIGEKLFIKANIFLEDVFENLLINAIRHNNNLIIEITVRILRERRVGINYLKIEFLDNGFGVADSMKEEIFQRGYSKEKGVYGMGLGLSLVRGIIETYNGKIWVEDRVEGDRSKGSNFVLLIPEVD